MGEKRPQPTLTLIKRLRRVAKWLDRCAEIDGPLERVRHRANANTCLQASARLALFIDPDTPSCENCSCVATTEDSCGVRLCDCCLSSIERES